MVRWTKAFDRIIDQTLTQSILKSVQRVSEDPVKGGKASVPRVNMSKPI